MSAETDALQKALAAEHAAIWAYGVIGAHAGSAHNASITAIGQEHRVRRDAIEAALVTASATPTPASGGYQLPTPVADAATALAAAGHVEDAVTKTWRYVLGQLTDPAHRTLAFDALSHSAGYSLTWRRAADPNAAVYPFPGQ